MSELEQVERDSETERRAESEGRALLEQAEIEEDTTSRILDATNTQLEAAEGTRRRSAISHLRAAVAATVADRLLRGGKSADKEDEAEPYREDLAEVMQPGKAAASDGAPLPAPLVLVSEQRIDTAASDQEEAPEVAEQAPEEAVEVTPIRPRRIHRSAVAVRESEEETFAVSESEEQKLLAESSSFSEFAERMGATELPDLLEAAAAYTAYVEGRPHFSRPQIMRRVAKLSADDGFNREDGLRSFGQLLRQGKIQKIKRGQFVIAETTRFKPESRFAGE